MNLDLPLVLAALGLMCVVEGLVLALLPRRMDEILRLVAELSAETRRMIGLGAVTSGLVLIWLAGLWQG